MSTTRPTLVLLGGTRGLSAAYRQVAEESGYVLRHYERSTPDPTTTADLVILVVGVAGHAQRPQAQRLAARSGQRLLEMRQPSVSALRRVLAAVRQ